MHCSSGVRCEFCTNCFSVPEHLAGAALGCVHISAAEQSLPPSPCSYLSSSSSSSHKSGSSLAGWHRSLHPSCLMEVKVICLQHRSTAWAFPGSSITQVVPGLEWEQLGEHVLGARPGTATEFYGFIIPTHKPSPSRAPSHFPVFIIVQQDLNSKSSKVNRPVQKVQETDRLQSMNFNALHDNNMLFLNWRAAHDQHYFSNWERWQRPRKGAIAAVRQPACK